MRVFNSFNEVADFTRCRSWEVEEAFINYTGCGYMVVNEVEFQIVNYDGGLKYVFVDKNNNSDIKDFIMAYEKEAYDWKVYVDDIEKWQPIEEIIDIKNTYWEIDRAVVITKSGTQVNRRVKYVLGEEDTDLKSDGCIYYYDKLEVIA